MQDATVQIETTIVLKGAEMPVPFLMPRKDVIAHSLCSGVIVDKTGGILSKPETLIVTAEHCLDTNVGDKTELGEVADVKIVVRDWRGKECKLVPYVHGADEQTHDVSTAVADCDLGAVAEIAKSVPARQAQVNVSGHPTGIFPGIITTGYFSGWLGGYELLSCPATGGSSGGPVFDSEGRVVGLLTRRNGDFEQITLAASLKDVKERIRQSADWKHFL